MSAPPTTVFQTILEDHEPWTVVHGNGRRTYTPNCSTCSHDYVVPWPCDAARLARVLLRLQGRGAARTPAELAMAKLTQAAREA